MTKRSNFTTNTNKVENLSTYLSNNPRHDHCVCVMTILLRYDQVCSVLHLYTLSLQVSPTVSNFVPSVRFTCPLCHLQQLCTSVKHTRSDMLMVCFILPLCQTLGQKRRSRTTHRSTNSLTSQKHPFELINLNSVSILKSKNFHPGNYKLVSFNLQLKSLYTVYLGRNCDFRIVPDCIFQFGNFSLGLCFPLVCLTVDC